MSLELSAEAVGYMKRHNIRGLFERLLKDLTVHKPSDPISFLIERLKKKEGPKIIIAGAPASGKGTQCERIVESFGVAHISTGDLLRAAVAAKSELGMKAQKYMDAGDLVPDEVVIGLVKERLKEPDCMEKGWLLDGFPRTRPQALALQSSGVLADKFIYLDVPDDTVVERISNRRQDPVTGKIYHLVYAPPESDEIASRLTQRSDDSEETVRRRLQNFHRNIGPVMEAYRHVCQTFDGTRKPDEIFKDIKDFITFSGSSVISQGLKVIISGAPASGKGTQCEHIVENFGVVHISTGDLLRSEISKGSEIGIEAKKWIDQGQLVPDDVIINMVRDRLSQTDCKNKGWLLDGFPRTKSQALALSAMGVLPDKFVQLDVPDHVIVERVTGRRLDPTTGKIYHIKFSPPPADVADRCIQREDDNEETCRKRLDVYHKNADEVIDSYRSLVHRIDGNRSAVDVASDIKSYLQE
eukprot:TRINITY_DN1221_c0_g1_i2.p1 TRINITY_DN1221_c0_g1~~TRINITY_DN1221_c0_g1_i2.p1  ORF type:complete len:469 (-),score=131.11 TRINITY_DN1221_c0_g1_i2:169-1575(-)